MIKMKSKSYRRIMTVFMATAMMALTALPIFAAENGTESTKKPEIALEVGTDRVTYRVDTENGIAGGEAAAAPAEKESESREKLQERKCRLRTQLKPGKIQR